MTDIEIHLKNVQDALLTADAMMTAQAAEITKLRAELAACRAESAGAVAIKSMNAVLREALMSPVYLRAHADLARDGKHSLLTMIDCLEGAADEIDRLRAALQPSEPEVLDAGAVEYKFTERAFKIIGTAAGVQDDWSEFDHGLLNLAREADELIASLTPALHGPFGYLVIDPELNEEHWTLSFSSGEPEHISLPMFTKVDPFNHLPALSQPSEPDGIGGGS